MCVDLWWGWQLRVGAGFHAGVELGVAAAVGGLAKALAGGHLQLARVQAVPPPPLPASAAVGRSRGGRRRALRCARQLRPHEPSVVATALCEEVVDTAQEMKGGREVR